MRGLRVLLDANVLVDAQVRDLFCHFAEAGLIDIRWSAQVLDETRRALIGRLGLDAARVDRLLAALDRAFPEAAVVGFDEVVEEIDLPGP